jgi:hypothetical protein
LDEPTDIRRSDLFDPLLHCGVCWDKVSWY